MLNKVLTIGSPEEVQAFGARHQRFFDNFESLKKALEVAFVRTIKGSAADPIIFYLGWRCVDDFWEILLLASNGYGLGATAHLRGMFERVVTAAYLHIEPSTSDDFIDYDFVRMFKVAKALRETFGVTPEDEKRFAELEENFNRVRDRFLIPDCEKCGTKRLNHTWSRLDVVSMAGKVSKTMGRLRDAVVPAYYFPLAQAHSTFASLSARLKMVDGAVTFKEGPLRKDADRSFQFAHLLLLNMLNTQLEHFQLEPLKEPLKAAFEGYMKIWFPEGLPSG
jgi:hypothetical protein